jgi:hypothetical protein
VILPAKFDTINRHASIVTNPIANSPLLGRFRDPADSYTANYEGIGCFSIA